MSLTFKQQKKDLTATNLERAKAFQLRNIRLRCYCGINYHSCWSKILKELGCKIMCFTYFNYYQCTLNISKLDFLSNVSICTNCTRWKQRHTLWHKYLLLAIRHYQMKQYFLVLITITSFCKMLDRQLTEVANQLITQLQLLHSIVVLPSSASSSSELKGKKRGD